MDREKPSEKSPRICRKYFKIWLLERLASLEKGEAWCCSCDYWPKSREVPWTCISQWYLHCYASFSQEAIAHYAALMDHELGHNLRVKHDHVACNAMARTSVVCTNLLLQMWASATAASTTSTSCYVSTERTACFINLSSKATLESHTVGIREWIKKNVIWLWQHPSLSKRLLLSALMPAKEGFRLCIWILLQKLQIVQGTHTLPPQCGWVWPPRIL